MKPVVVSSEGKATAYEGNIVGQPCPVCGKGTIIKGKTAYGCSNWRNGCTFRKPFGEENPQATQ